MLKIEYYGYFCAASFAMPMLPTLSEEPQITAWALAGTAAFLIGVSKAGLKGLANFNVILMALAFGAKPSTGLILPLLIVGDVFAVIYYNRHAQWKYIINILPWMIIGVLIGLFIGKDLPEKLFKFGMASIVFVSLAILIYMDKRKSKKVPDNIVFASSMGIFAGICTMIGNLAGAITNVFFLALRLPKNQFVGTAAWLFLITNGFKLPLHFFVWKTISPQTLTINLQLLPAILIGLFVGIKVVKLINEKNYRKFIIAVTFIGAILIVLK